METELPVCPSNFTYMTYRLDKPDGKPWCSDVHRFAPHYSMKSALCCPKQQTLRNCSWTNDNFDPPGVDDDAWDWVCKPSKCPKGSVEFGSVLHPATSKAELGKGGISCESVTLPSNTDSEFSLCDIARRGDDPILERNQSHPWRAQVVYDTTSTQSSGDGTRCRLRGYRC